MKRSIFYILSFILLSTLLDCSRPNRMQQRLQQLDSLVSEHPDSVLSVLEMLADTVSDQPEAVRMRYALLKVKAKDKAYLPHGDDSLITAVSSYYETHPDDRLTPEALYYVGRVHADMGDAPQALDDFQSCISKIRRLDDPFLLLLHSVANAQIGYVFRDMDLYETSIPFFSTSLQDARTLADTIRMNYNYRDLAISYFWTGKRDSALFCYQRSKFLAEALGDSALILDVMINQSAYYRDLGDFRRALELNSKILQYAKGVGHVNAVYLQGELYHRVGLLDSALYYYKQYLNSDDAVTNLQESASKGLGEIAVMQGRLTDAVHHFNDYIDYYTIADSMRKQEAILKSLGLYNYQIRERENHSLNLQIEKDSKHRLVLYGIIIIVLLMVYILGREYRINRHRIDLQHKRLEHWQRLQIQQQQKPALNDERLLQLKHSQSMHVITNALSEDRPIKDEEWEIIEHDINLIYENFTIQLHDTGRMNIIDYHVCLLVKMEVIPKDIANLVGRTTAAITQIRKRLYSKCFGRVGTAAEWDKYVKAL